MKKIMDEILEKIEKEEKYEDYILKLLKNCEKDISPDVHIILKELVENNIILKRQVYMITAIIEGYSKSQSPL